MKHQPMIKTLTFRTYGYLTYYIIIANASPLPPPQNLTSTHFLKGILVLIFAGSGEPPKTVLLLEYLQEVKMRFFFHST